MGSIICVNCGKRHIMTCPDCGRRFCRQSHGQKWCPQCAKVNIYEKWKAARIQRGERRGLGIGRSGPGNGGWKGGVSQKWAWKFKKDYCEKCHTTERLEAHHIDENPRNNTEENIQTLCVRCHTQAHSRPRTCIKCSTTYVSGRGFKRCPPCKKTHEKNYRREYYKNYERRV